MIYVSHFIKDDVLNYFFYKNKSFLYINQICSLVYRQFPVYKTL